MMIPAIAASTAAPSTTATATTTISYLKKAGEMTTEPKYRSRI